MQWLSAIALKPALPDHCEPTSDFLLRFSSTFHVCVPTTLGFVSNTLGILSIVSWLFAQLPQIYKNYNIKSTSGLSIFFLVEWCLGDLSNLLGALFTHQAHWQVAIGAYYVFVDLCLVGQWFWYEKLKHGRLVRRIYGTDAGTHDHDGDTGSMEQVLIEGVSANGGEEVLAAAMEDQRTGSRPRIIFHQPDFQKDSKAEDEKPSPSLSATPNGTTIHRLGAPSSSFPSPSPRTILMIACLMALAQARPTEVPAPDTLLSHEPTDLETAGTILSWTSTLLYLGSRFPQLFKNYSRKSTAGLSPHLFMAAFFGNLFYSSALLTNPNAWNDFGPYGGGGWVGREGSESAQWIAAALPFFLGAAGVLGLDASVGVQFLMYGDGDAKMVVIEGKRGQRWRWRKIEGWMRGWMPSISENQGKGEERAALLDRNEEGGVGYGAL